MRYVESTNHGGDSGFSAYRNPVRLRESANHTKAARNAMPHVPTAKTHARLRARTAERRVSESILLLTPKSYHANGLRRRRNICPSCPMWESDSPRWQTSGESLRYHVSQHCSGL